MKRTYIRTDEEGVVWIATVNRESNAVVVSEKKRGSSSKGKPVRIPAALAEGGNLDSEVLRQAMQLEAKGYKLEATEGTADSLDRVCYLNIPQSGQDPGRAMRVIRDANLQERIKGLSVRDLGEDGIEVAAGTQVLMLGPACGDQAKSIPLESPLLAVGLILARNGACTIVMDSQNGAVVLSSPSELHALAMSIADADVREVLLDNGVGGLRVAKAAVPGVVIF